MNYVDPYFEPPLKRVDIVFRPDGVTLIHETPAESLAGTMCSLMAERDKYRAMYEFVSNCLTVANEENAELRAKLGEGEPSTFHTDKPDAAALAFARATVPDAWGR